MKSRCICGAFILFCAVGLLSLPAVAGTWAPDTFVLAKPALKTGNIRRLMRTVTTLDARKGNEKHAEVVKIVEKYFRTVKALRHDGSVIFVFQMEARHMFKDGKKVLSPDQPPTMTVMRLPDGKLTEVAKGKKLNEDTSVGAEVQDPLDEAENLYPQKAVAVGDQWPITYMSRSNGLGQAELTAATQMAGAKALNIKFTAEGNVKNTIGKFHVEGVITVNAMTCEVLKYETNESITTEEQILTCHIVLLALGKDPKEDPK